MFKQIFNKLPRKSSKGSGHREHGASGRNHGVSTSKSSDLVTPQSSKPGNSSTLNAGQNHGNRVPLPLGVNENPNGNFSSCEALPAFRDVPSSEKPTLFIKKLSMCSVVFDLIDPTKHLREKEIKRQALVELVDYVTSVNAKFTENVMQEVVKMVSANIFRSMKRLFLEYSKIRSMKRLFLDGNFLVGKPPVELLTVGMAVSGSLGDNCLQSCPVSSQLCTPTQKSISVCKQAYRGRQRTREKKKGGWESNRVWEGVGEGGGK